MTNTRCWTLGIPGSVISSDSLSFGSLYLTGRQELEYGREVTRGRGSRVEVRGKSRVLRQWSIALVCMSVVAVLSGCDWIGGRTVMVEFQSADGIEGGQPVYFAGVKIGKTGSPTIVKGHARVPVYLSRSQRDALPVGAVFAIGDDPNQVGSRCLLGYAVSAVPLRAENGAEIYQGVSNELELALLLGAEKARELMEQLQR